MYIKTESGPLLKSYSDFRTANFSNQLKASYLYHLGQLKIINTDVTNLPDDIFSAIKNLQEAQAIVTSGNKLSSDDE